MSKIASPFFYFFLILTVVITLIHLKKVEFYENPSKDIIEKLYTGLTGVSTYLSKENSKSYRLSLSFNHIETEIYVDTIDVKIIGVLDPKHSSLGIIKILPFSGMHNWDIPEFKTFKEIPANLKLLNKESNPYFAYDFILNSSDLQEIEKFNVTVFLNFRENSIRKKIKREFTILKKNKIQLRPFDAHSDGSFLLIPIFGIITIILAIINFLSNLKRL